MKYKPIENAKLYGCMNCSPVPNKTLQRGRKMFLYGMLSAFFDVNIEESWKNSIDLTELTELDEGFTLEQIEKRCKDKIENCQHAFIEFMGMMHGEVYELNKDDGEWYLINQSKGMA